MTKKYLWFAIALCWFKIVTEAFSKLFVNRVWDDAYMFYRYTGNILSYGEVSWNPGEQPTYGLTSNLYLLIVLPIRYLLADNPTLVMTLSSLFCGFLFLILITIILVQYTNVSNPLVKLAVVLFIFFNFALSAEHLATHFVNGMDTSFALAYITAYIILSKRYEHSLSILSAIMVGIVGGLAFSARPDLMVYSYIIPLSLIAFAIDDKAKRNGLMILGITCIVTIGQLWFAHRYFNAFLPLPFYAKSLRAYGDLIYEFYKYAPIKELLAYITSYWCLWLVIIVNLCIHYKMRFFKSSPIDTGLTVATSFFILYYLFFVLQILHYHQRFYYPTLPAIVVLASHSMSNLAGKIPQSMKHRFVKYQHHICLLIVFFLCGYVFIVSKPMNVISSVNQTGFANLSLCAPPWIDNYWFGITKFSALPDDLVIATSEVGRVGAMNPRKIIIDLAGLHERYFAHGGFSADVLFKKYHPDLIYMPHLHYKEMITQIVTHPYFIIDYEYFPASELGTKWMGLALWRKSKHYHVMRKIVEDSIAH